MHQQGDPREQPLRRHLLAPFTAFAWGTGLQHLDPDLIAMHASGELPADQGLAAAAHLAVCDDGCCRALLREEAAALEAVRCAMFEVSPESPSWSDERPRTFECSDSLWEVFEGMASEMGCPVDHLVVEAMQAHLQGQGYSPQQAKAAEAVRPGAPHPPPQQWPPPQQPPLPPHRMVPPPPPAPQAGGGRPPRATPFPSSAYGTPAPPPAKEPRPAPPPPHQQGGYVMPPAPHPQGGHATPLPPHPQGGYGTPPPQLHGSYGAQQPQQPSFGGPPQLQPSFGGPPLQQQHPAPQGPPPPAQHGGMPPLVVMHAAGRALVDKDRFIIGRGKQASDLAIKDPNISRQHATVEFVGGRFYIVDMGSTNGILFEGERIARKQIEEGDRFIIGDHEIMFSYRT